MSFKSTQPTLAELTDRMLKQRAVDLINTAEGDVEPHEVLNSFRTDPRTAYTDTVLPLTLLGVRGLPTTLPPDWAAYTNSDVGTVAVPMAAGLFPQRVRDLNDLLSAADLTTLAPNGSDTEHGFSALRGWVNKNSTTEGVKSLARGIGLALGSEPKTADDSAVSQNETATAHWLAGRHSEAVAQWLAMPDNPVAAFNRGMGLLFTGRAAEAIPHLRQAATALPDTSGWSHLAHLYLAIAETRR